MTVQIFLPSFFFSDRTWIHNRKSSFKTDTLEAVFVQVRQEYIRDRDDYFEREFKHLPSIYSEDEILKIKNSYPSEISGMIDNEDYKIPVLE